MGMCSCGEIITGNAMFYDDSMVILINSDTIQVDFSRLECPYLFAQAYLPGIDRH